VGHLGLSAAYAPFVQHHGRRAEALRVAPWFGISPLGDMGPPRFDLVNRLVSTS
jgi:hypothetical protein